MKNDLNKKKPLIAVILAASALISIGFFTYALQQQTQNDKLKAQIESLEVRLENCQSTQPK